MAIFQSSQILSSDGTVYSFSPTTATIDGFSFAIPESFNIYHYDVLKVDENTKQCDRKKIKIDLYTKRSVCLATRGGGL